MCRKKMKSKWRMLKQLYFRKNCKNGRKLWVIEEWATKVLYTTNTCTTESRLLYYPVPEIPCHESSQRTRLQHWSPHFPWLPRRSFHSNRSKADAKTKWSFLDFGTSFTPCRRYIHSLEAISFSFLILFVWTLHPSLHSKGVTIHSITLLMTNRIGYRITLLFRISKIQSMKPPFFFLVFILSPWCTELFVLLRERATASLHFLR